MPGVFVLTDPRRMPNPAAVASRLPQDTGMIYRHFGAPDRGLVANTLVRIGRARGLTVLIAADPDLAVEVGAAGVHWPERLIGTLAMRISRGKTGLTTAAAHSMSAIVKAAALGVDGVFLSPVFATRSAGSSAPLGLMRSRLAAMNAKRQMTRWSRSTPKLYALGGVTTRTAQRVKGWADGFGIVEAAL